MKKITFEDALKIARDKKLIPFPRINESGRKKAVAFAKALCAGKPFDEAGVIAEFENIGSHFLSPDHPVNNSDKFLGATPAVLQIIDSKISNICVDDFDWFVDDNGA